MHRVGLSPLNDPEDSGCIGSQDTTDQRRDRDRGETKKAGYEPFNQRSRGLRHFKA